MYAYVNGEYLPDEKATISIHDRGFTNGEALFDSTRTFGGRVFKLEDHLDRLRKSLNYAELDGPRIVTEARDAVGGVVERSRAEIESADDVMVNIYVSSGVSNRRVADRSGRHTLVVSLRPLEHAVMAPLYDSGIDLGISLSVKHFQGSVDKRVKTTSRLGAIRGRWKASRAIAAAGDRSGWTVVFNDDGSISEAGGANVSLVEGKTLVRPMRHDALEGISLETAGDIARDAGMQVEERTIWLYDLINADEVFITASSFQILPIASIDGIGLSPKREAFKRLLQGWFEVAGMDFVAQSRAHLAAGAEKVTTAR